MNLEAKRRFEETGLSDWLGGVRWSSFSQDVY